MLIEKGIELLKEFAHNKENEEFREFANHLHLFAQKHKTEYNINNFETFVSLIDKQTDRNDEARLKMAFSSIYIAQECVENGFVDYEKFYESFISKQTNKKVAEMVVENRNLQGYSVQNQEDQEEIESEQPEELIRELESSLSLSQQVDEEKLEISKLKALKSVDEFYNPQDKTSINKIEQNVSVEMMLAFIKDKEQLYFPFSKEATLDNKNFRENLFKSLKNQSPQELQKLIDELRAKNEALRNEILELSGNKANLMKELQTELVDNYKLSAFHKVNETKQQQSFTEMQGSALLVEDSRTRDAQNKYRKKQR